MTISTTATRSTVDWSVLAQFLAQDLATSQQLQEVLIRERQSLEQRDYADFDALLHRKSELLATLERSTAERRRWQEQVRLGDDNAALAAVAEDEPELATRWQSLATLWRHCQHASQVNEQICQRTRTVIGRVLDLMSGNAGQGATYDAAGTTRRLQTGRNITSA